jgi:cytidylate kinase
MFPKSAEHGKAFGRAAEQRMRQWAIQLEIEQRMPHDEAVTHLPQRVRPYVAISRETGAGARELCERLGKRLGWDVLGRELLDEMASKYQLERGMVGAFDESAGSWLMDVFGKWLDHRIVVPTEYITRLGSVVLMAAHNDSAIFLGRGAQFFLPRDRGVAVRIVAPLNTRVDRVAEIQQVSTAQAKRFVAQQDKTRHDFVQQYFRRDVADAHLYDLVINLAFVTMDDAAELIARQCERRFDLSE